MSVKMAPTIWIAVDARGLRSITGAKSQAEADAAVTRLDASYPEDAPHRVFRYELVGIGDSSRLDRGELAELQGGAPS